METIELCLLDPLGGLTKPFMTINVQRQRIPMLLLAIRGLQLYLPVRVTHQGRLLTQVIIRAEGAQIKGEATCSG